MENNENFLESIQKLDDYIINSQKKVNEQVDTKSLVYHTKFCVLFSLLKNYVDYRRWIWNFPVEISLDNNCLRKSNDLCREFFVNDTLETLIDKANSSYDFSEEALECKENDAIQRIIYRDLHVKEGTKDKLAEFEDVKVICKNVFDSDINRSSICFHFVGDDPSRINTPKTWTIEYIDNQVNKTTIICDFTNNHNFSLMSVFKKLFDCMLKEVK